MRLHVALLLLPLAGAFCSAQTFQPKTITFTGAPALSQAEQLAASGLAPGKPVSAADIQAATQRLADTGAFAEVRFTYDGQSISFNVKPAEAMVPAHYVNFPWWTDAALTGEIAARVPLFHGSVPLSGAMEGNVSHAIGELLAAKHVTASIEANPETNEKNGEVAAIAFRLNEPQVVVGALSFTGDTSGWAAALAEVSLAQTGREYAEASSTSLLKDAVLHVYRSKGFAQAAVTAMQAAPPPEEGAKITVPFSIAVTAGPQYRLGHFVLTGSTLIDEAAFLKAAPLKPGDLAEDDKLRQSLFLVTYPYASQGYIEAKVNAVPAFHAEQRIVDYTITVAPGEAYRMGQLTVNDLDAARRGKVLEVWAMKPGTPFDTTYAPTFLRKNKERLHELDGYSATYKQIKHLDTHIVDLEVTFKKDRALGAE